MLNNLTNSSTTYSVLFHKPRELLFLGAVPAYLRTLQIHTQILYTLEMGALQEILEKAVLPAK